MLSYRISALIVAIGAAATAFAPVARADDVVTYEIVSDSVPMMNEIQYVDPIGRTVIQNVRLPWRLDMTIDDAEGPTGRGAQLRADWRPSAWPGRWVRVNIFSNGRLLCQSTLDIGNATCYGNTPHMS